MPKIETSFGFPGGCLATLQLNARVSWPSRMAAQAYCPKAMRLLMSNVPRGLNGIRADVVG